MKKDEKMKIKVKVIDDTTCLHEETHTDKYDFGHADPIRGDYVEDYQDVEVCNNCGAWRTFKRGKLIEYPDGHSSEVVDDEEGEWQEPLQ